MRVKLLRISNQFFSHLMKKPDDGTFFHCVDCFLPDDAEIINAKFNIEYAAFDLMIRSEAYPDVQEGCPILFVASPNYSELRILPNQPEFKSLNIPAITGSVAT